MEGIEMGEDNYNEKLANYIKKARQIFGYTQKELAQEAGVSLTTIKRVEAGEQIPQVYTLNLILNVLGRS